MMRSYVKRAVQGQPWRARSLLEAYEWPKDCAGGGRIAIGELGGAFSEDDLVEFCRLNGFPVPTVSHIGPDGKPIQASPFPSSDADVEVMLDVELAAASYSFATGGQAADITLIWHTDIVAASQLAQGYDVLSWSWGADEAIWLDQNRHSVRQLESTMRLLTEGGTVVLAAAGDNDSSDGGPNPANVDAPASCPHVIACGGTRTVEDTFGLLESVWNNNPGNPDGNGTGGGFSSAFLPSDAPWMAGVPNGPGRMVPDLAANADPETGWLIVAGGQEGPIGGTSAVSPLMTGLFAAIGKGLGFIAPVLWRNHVAFVDVTRGDNGMFRAGPGPDPCSGLGRPIGTRLAKLFGK